MDTSQPNPPHEHSPGPPEADDPRLAIPEALREPVRHPSLEPRKPSIMSGAIGEAGTALAIGIDFMVVIATGAGLGWLADKQFGWTPVGLIAGLGIGLVAGLGRLIHRLAKEDRKQSEQTRANVKK